VARPGGVNRQPRPCVAALPVGVEPRGLERGGAHDPGGASVLASLRVVSIGMTRQQPRPTERRFMESGLVLSDLLRDLEPEVPRTWPSAPRFMESE